VEVGVVCCSLGWVDADVVCCSLGCVEEVVCCSDGWVVVVGGDVGLVVLPVVVGQLNPML
jgi:hypothetical protein